MPCRPYPMHLECSGYSDHTDGIATSIAAVAMGATVIEKHLTLDRSMEGPDHLASLEPMNLLIWCKASALWNKY